jgi:hypothetical protein
MRFLIVVLVLVVSVIPGFATVDPDPDQIGLYFDTNADVTCIDVLPSTPFWAYLVISNPSSPEVWGVEFSLCVEVIGGSPSLLFRLSEDWEIDDVSQPVVIDWCNDGAIRGWASPILPQDNNALIVSFQYMLLAEMGLNFYLGAVSTQAIEDGLPAYLGTGDVVLPLGVSSGNTGLPVASVNGCNAVPVEGSTFGGLKCLFR